MVFLFKNKVVEISDGVILLHWVERAVLLLQKSGNETNRVECWAPDPGVDGFFRCSAHEDRSEAVVEFYVKLGERISV